MTSLRLSALSSLLALAAMGSAQNGAMASFAGIGFLPGGGNSFATALSADGTTVAAYGTSTPGTQAGRWRAGTGFVGLGDLPGFTYESYSFGLNATGDVLVGQGAGTSGGNQATRWTSAGLVGLGQAPGRFFSAARATSADGSVVVGEFSNSNGREAFRWTQATGYVSLGDLPGGPVRSSAYAANADGSVIVGVGTSNVSEFATRWTAAMGMVQIIPDSAQIPGQGSLATGVSADGNTVVGIIAERAFRWTPADGYARLPKLFGEGGGSDHAIGISPDGSLIGGFSFNASEQRAVIWPGLAAPVDVQSALVDAGLGAQLTGWRLEQVNGVTVVNGQAYATGTGRNPQGRSEGWYAAVPLRSTPVPEPATLAALALGAAALLRRRRR